MSDVAIRVTGLSKRYKLGARRPRHDTLRDQLVYGVSSWFARNGNGKPSLGGNSADVHWALKDVSFIVKNGAVFGFVGRNGAEKVLC
jgi:lipopolysaccharide transport system ATP-binding protein